ncbi:GIY-YIG nuclease family protein [Halorussus gelatinilyticus]|uniref:GIY-YIG nuclease family protein n=1 Tax=Halorussus gelatinilyticus TaxID=2937524 RepID=A0A8U0IFA7_9EURY|nr:GIY-YIG nuclease family protein [Halorussus gelatinilyticus]UPV99759.1 GIY-YIG nuclease family protein [Halorussus gelatinilyticus]
MPKGTYTLLVELADDAAVAFGAAGERDLAAGWYAYTGSAFGTGGFARVERHRELARGERDARHWHVDYLLGHPASRVAEVVTTAGADVECEVSRGIETDDAAESVAGLGASDCDCDSHLKFAPERKRLEQVVRRAHAAGADDR